jgi:hypothetical protein
MHYPLRMELKCNTLTTEPGDEMQTRENGRVKPGPSAGCNYPAMTTWLAVAAILGICAASIVCFSGILCFPSTNAKEFAKSLAAERVKLQELGEKQLQFWFYGFSGLCGPCLAHRFQD